MRSRVKRMLFGAPRDLHDPSIGHKISLIAFLAWLGLGADGLSSSGAEIKALPENSTAWAKLDARGDMCSGQKSPTSSAAS